jgi:tRNA threonylcarbamoyladenosine biosynthesis protein TsaE
VTPFNFDANDEQDTDRFGAALAHVLPLGTVVSLTGTLGAGKTRLVQAVAKSIGIDPREVVSPTFVLVHEYVVPSASSPRAPVSTVYHFDAYRIRDDDEFRELGSEEYFESDGWTFIEWADRVKNCLPQDYLQIGIEVTGSTQRRFTVTSIGERATTIVQALRATLGSFA